MEVARSFLLGLREAIGVGLQLTQVQQNQLVMQQAKGAVTLESEKPDLLDTLKRADEVLSEVELSPYWAGFVRLQKAEWNATIFPSTYSTDNWVSCSEPRKATCQLAKLFHGRL